ncbi:MAG TPA: 50S ribosomal protein L15 [Anaerolineae bacterium]|nr:MAG: 50S ribosomal protein L15 [Chloroflexi bacterium ADurb.Bin222]HOC21022.1 50S ribosomal protein L15 [Anaerolineae bacterium]HOS78686.1 50S ribosomal protein L15 [Anaerolineae bacterium]HQM13975.1 50S ribosomal protein L15 [Anaerolineae bacterium]
MKLHELQPAAGATKRKRRVGRGIAAGQGKTAGRGTKGQGARSHKGISPYFEGGQLPLVRKLPFARGYGFLQPYRVQFQPINVGQLAEKYAAGEEVTPQTLTERGLLKHSRDLVSVLGEGELDRALHVKVQRISAGARAKIEAAGGTVELLPWQRGGYRTR